MEKARIGGIMKKTHLGEVGVLGVPDRTGIASAILGAVGRARINVPFVVQCIDLNRQSHVVFCVERDDLDTTLRIMDSVKGDIGASGVTSLQDVAVVSIFGPDFRERPGIAGTMFEALAARGVNIHAISTSISTVSCVIDGDRLEEAVVAIQEAFELP